VCLCSLCRTRQKKWRRPSGSQINDVGRYTAVCVCVRVGFIKRKPNRLFHPHFHSTRKNKEQRRRRGRCSNGKICSHISTDWRDLDFFSSHGLYPTAHVRV
jgi:hypothetical protein